MSVRSVTIVLFVLIISAAVFADAPSITGIADNPDPVLAGNDITFDANWTDADGNSAKMYVCTTGTFDTGSRTCTDGSYCSSDYNSTPEENSCNYTTQTADIVTSPNDYYLFVCDDNECSSSSPSDFTVNANPVCSIESTTTPIVKGANTTITISYSGFGSNPTGYGSIDFGDVNAGEINLDCSSGTACTLEAGPYNNAGSFTIQNLYGLSDGTSDVNCTGSATVTVDDTPPSASVKNIAGDSSSPYYDTSDEHSTNLVISGESEMTCRFDSENKNTYYDLQTTTVCTTSGTDSTCPLGDLDQNTYTYYYACVDSLDNNSAVSSVSFGVDWTIPAQVTGLSSSGQSSSSITLTWTANSESDLDYYRVYRNGSEIGTPDEGTISYTDSGLSNNTSYTYKVSAVDDAGLEGTASTNYSASTSSGTTPSKPNITSSHSEDSWTNNDDPDFDWDAVSGATRYECEFDTSSGTIPTSESGCNDREVSFEDTDDGTWYFHVRACADNCSDTDHYKIKIDTSKPGQVDNFSARLTSSDDISLTWEPASDSGSGVKEYEIYRHTASGFDLTDTRRIATVDGDDEDYTDTDSLTDERKYYYRILAVDYAGNKGDERETSETAEGKVCDLELSIDPESYIGTGEVEIRITADDKRIYRFAVTSWIYGIRLISPNKSGDDYEKILKYNIDNGYEGEQLKIEVYAEDSDDDPCGLTKFLRIDATKPEVSIESPINNDNLSGTVKLSARASDETAGVKEVNFYYKDGGNWTLLGKAEKNGDLFELDWDTKTVLNDSYEIKAEAEDNAKNKEETVVTLSIENGETIITPAPLEEKEMTCIYDGKDVLALFEEAGLDSSLLGEANNLIESCNIKRKIILTPEGDSYTAEFIITVTNNTGYEANLQIIEVIPKSIMKYASLLAEGDFDVLADDPVIKFNLFSVKAGEEINLSYKLKDTVTKEEAEEMVNNNVANDFKAPPILLYSETDLKDSFSEHDAGSDTTGLVGLIGLAGTIIGGLIVLAVIGIGAVYAINNRSSEPEFYSSGLHSAYGKEKGILSKIKEKVDDVLREDDRPRDGKFSWKGN